MWKQAGAEKWVETASMHAKCRLYLCRFHCFFLAQMASRPCLHQSQPPGPLFDMRLDMRLGMRLDMRLDMSWT